MKVIISVAANNEYREACDWYNAQKTGLGRELRKEIKATLKRVKRFPFFNTEIDPGYYAAYVKIYPYKIIYKVDGDVILVLAYAHLSREPNYWQG